jgi:hypothetical protein
MKLIRQGVHFLTYLIFKSLRTPPVRYLTFLSENVKSANGRSVQNPTYPEFLR